ncbi:MAG: CDP-glucose 4,6-dehydratase [Thiothrix sp.]|nr:MAG: CDP-glucose 4,6-dehydratase [Thiothrix sp.]
MNPEKNFWQGKTVLVTGHTGFKGSWMSLWLQGMGATVVGYSLAPPTEPSLYKDARVEEGINANEADIRDLARLQQVISDSKPDIIFHLAAQPLVRYSYDHPIETYETNVMGTVNVLESARRESSVKVVVCITTDKCYENREWVWGYRENEPMGGFDPYSSSKGCSELVISAYRNSYFSSGEGPAVASVRAGNVIGGGDWAEDRLIPDIVRAMMKDEAVIIRAPHSIRPWQHVLEPLSGYMLLAERLWNEKEAFSEAWNFGPNDEDAQPVEWIVDHLTQSWGEGARWELDKEVNPHEAQYLKLDISKVKTVLGYEPRLNLATTLDWVTEWYKAYHKGDDMRQITRQQIAQFEAKGKA